VFVDKFVDNGAVWVTVFDGAPYRPPDAVATVPTPNTGAAAGWGKPKPSAVAGCDVWPELKFGTAAGFAGACADPKEKPPAGAGADAGAPNTPIADAPKLKAGWGALLLATNPKGIVIGVSRWFV
jgi:hypothetical protein